MEQMKHFSYDQELTYHELYEGNDHPVYCQACCEVISGPAYIHDNNSTYIYGLHKSCSELLPGEIQHPLHPHHPLRAVCRRNAVADAASDDGFICDGCRHYSWGFKYCCEECKFKLDVRCVLKRESESQLVASKKRAKIRTDFHNHKLQLFYYDMLLSTPFFTDICCCYCLKGFQGSAYACVNCELFIHESCLDKIPIQVQSPFHPKHPLLLGEPCELNYCRACGKSIKGAMLSCVGCSYANHGFHILCCTQTARSLRLKYHNHSMFYIKDLDSGWSSAIKCVVCKTSCKHCATYRCVDCNVNVHMECIPLPCVVKHECHPDHALTLTVTDSVVLKNPSDEYRCDICEKEGDLRYHAYCCEDCSYIAHIECVLSEEDPPSEILQYLEPRSGDESEKETTNAEKETGDESKQKSNESQQENFGAEQEWNSDLEDCSLEELEKRMADVKRKMDALASEFQILKEKHAEKLLSQS